MTDYWVYDLETYPNFFSAGFQHLESGERWIFEISEFEDQRAPLTQFLARRPMTLIGYNNLNFDYPVLHQFLLNPVTTGHEMLFAKADAIIRSDRDDWSHHLWESDHIIPQIDLFKICHFDNFARSTSLKKLEIAMRSEHVEDIPVQPGTPVPFEMRQKVLDYMAWDISETRKFAHEIWDRIEFRQQLDQEYGGRTRINYNDTKIGKNFFLDELEKAGIPTKRNRKPIQTPREDGIHVKDILIPIEFETDNLRRIYNYFQQAIIPPYHTKGFFTDLSARLRDFELDFGSGGIHASVTSQTVRAEDEWDIIDADVTSYYPSLAIEYGQYPDHLGSRFVGIYRDLKERRVSYPKGSAPNAMLKLALNGTYGESNNKYSSFYDPQFTMFITINGQLLLARLMEVLLNNPSVTPIQMNTDGLTVRLPRSHRDWFFEVCRWWSEWSRMDLEFADYRVMAIRDVNNYIAIDTDGKVKRKGAYTIDPDFHQDHSSLIIPKAVSEYVENGTPLVDSIFHHADKFDFIRSVKVPRNSRLEWGDTQIQNTTRYFIGLDGKYLTKIMPPDRRRPDQERRIGVDKEWLTVPCNNINHFDWNNLNRPFYLQEAEKLLEGLGL